MDKRRINRRLTVAEIVDQYPHWKWNDEHPSIRGDCHYKMADCQHVEYGDWPAHRYNMDEYMQRDPDGGTFANVDAVDWWMFIANGNYAKYHTFIGDMCVFTKYRILSGEAHVRYNGYVYNIFLNDMYDSTSLTISKYNWNICINNYYGWCNDGKYVIDGFGHTSNVNKMKDLTDEEITTVLSLSPSVTDCYGASVKKYYGQVVQDFFGVCFNIYKSDIRNHYWKRSKGEK